MSNGKSSKYNSRRFRLVAATMATATAFRVTAGWMDQAIISEQGWITVILAGLGMYGLQRYGDKAIKARETNGHIIEAD